MRGSSAKNRRLRAERTAGLISLTLRTSDHEVPPNLMAAESVKPVGRLDTGALIVSRLNANPPISKSLASMLTPLPKRSRQS